MGNKGYRPTAGSTRATSPTAKPGAAALVPALTAYLDDPYQDVAAQVRKAMTTHADLLDDAHSLPTAAYRDRVRDVLIGLAESGNTGLGMPVEFGGGGDVGAAITAFQNLGYGDLSLEVKTGVQFGLVAGALLHLGTRPHHERFLPDVISGRSLGCFAMTETDHGSNVHAVQTTATYDPQTRELVIDTPHAGAVKDYIGNAAAHGRFAIVFAQLVVDGVDHGVHAVVVPIRDRRGRTVRGVTITDCGPKLGLNGVDNGRLSFDHVRVPKGNLLNRHADVADDGTYTSPITNPDKRFFTMLGTLVQGRVSVAGGALYASRVALAIAVRYANRRRQFGPPDSADEVTLMTYPTHQRRLIPLLAKAYALSAAQRELVLMHHESFSADHVVDEERRVLESRAAGQKAVATWFATQAIQTCREACGGAGYLAENRLAALKSDTDVFTTFEGDNTVLLQLVAKGLLTQYQQGFNDLDPLSLVRFAASQAVETVVERAALRQIVERLRDVGSNKDDDADLLDVRYHEALLRWREEHIRASLARRLKRGLDEGRPGFDVFTACQNHAVALANAHVERVVHAAFAASLERADAQLHPKLLQLVELHGLSVIEADRAWFLEHGRLSTERSKAITSMVSRLCALVAADAEVLTDAFAIPDELLRAPIAFGASSV